MALEISMTKDIIDDLSSLSETALEVGKSGVVKFEFIVHEDIDCEGGI